MPKLSDLVRVTTPDDAVWRTCAACLVLSAMAPEATTCDTCDACQPAEPGLADTPAGGGGGTR